MTQQLMAARRWWLTRPSSAAVLALTVAARLGCRWLMLPVWRCAEPRIDLCAGAAKTDPKDAQVLADYAWSNADRLTWTTITDELLARLRILNGRDTDLAGNATRAANRRRDALLAVSPSLEHAVGDKLVSVSGLRAALVKWPTPSALRTAGKVRVRGVISKRSKRTAAKLADQIWAALAAQTVTVVAETTWGETIGDLAGDLDRIIDRPFLTGSRLDKDGWKGATCGQKPSWTDPRPDSTGIRVCSCNVAEAEGSAGQCVNTGSTIQGTRCFCSMSLLRWLDRSATDGRENTDGGL